MISQKLFDRRMREIKRNNYYISDEQVEFFHKHKLIPIWSDAADDASDKYHFNVPSNLKHRSEKFIELVNTHHGKKIIYDYQGVK